jgi:hypothetical protein
VALAGAVLSDHGAGRLGGIDIHVEQVAVAHQQVAMCLGGGNEQALELVVGRVGSVGNLGERRLEPFQPARRDRVDERGPRGESARPCERER